jgi:pimeloyl-ACP methyl ester carboxylesterase
MADKNILGPAGRLHVDDGGDGDPPLFFVHAFAGSASQWRDQLAHVRRSHRAVALDLRGHGLSEARFDADLAVDSFADDIAAAADECRLDRFVLVGHSLGGAAAISYADAHPDRVLGLVLVSAPGRVPHDDARQILGAFERDFEQTYDGYWSRLLMGSGIEVEVRVRADAAHVSRGTTLRMLREVLAYDPVPKLRRFHGPATTITTPLADAPYELHNLLPGLMHVVIPGTSYWAFMDKPAEFNRLLDDIVNVSGR